MELVELNEPCGWVVIPLRDMNDKPVRTFMIQIAILSNHQNGRDTHMRHIKIHSPVQDILAVRNPAFTSTEMQIYSCIR